MKIGELAERGGVSVQAIRYYERKGLLRAPDRRPSGYREYTEPDVLRLSFIGRAKKLGFTLSEIRDLLELRVRPGRSADDVRRRAVEKIDSIRTKIQELGEITAALELLVLRCDAHGAPDTCALMHALGTSNDT